MQDIQHQFLVYTIEEIDGIQANDNMHKTILDVIHHQNSNALHDLILYTEIYDPDTLTDVVLKSLENDDKKWFITNSAVIKTMSEVAYTKMLIDILNDLKEFLTEQNEEEQPKIITAMLGLFNNPSVAKDDYDEVLNAWLKHDIIIEIFDFLAELNPRVIIKLGAQKDLFTLLEQILLNKIRLADEDINKIIPCLYATEVQTYLDMLGNYVMPQLCRCDPIIVRAYDAMRQYLVASGNLYESGIHFQIYIQFANKFHNDDREVFRQICHVIADFPEFVKFTTYYGAMAIFLECCRFELPDELIKILHRYDIKPATLNYDITNYKILAKIFYAATQPKPLPQIHDVLWLRGYFSGFIEWFKTANNQTLQIIDSCEWPLVAFINNTDDDIHYIPSTEFINLKAYDSPNLLMQFVSLNDLTFTDGEGKIDIQIYKTQANLLVQLLKEIRITRQEESDDIALLSKLQIYLRKNDRLLNPDQVQTKLYKLAVLETNGFIINKFYKYLEEEVFGKYIHSFISSPELGLDAYKLTELIDEYKPNYSILYLEAIIKSGLKANSLNFKNVIGLLKTIYPLSIITKDNPGLQTLIDMLGKVPAYSNKCAPESIVAKFAVILTHFYDISVIDHNNIICQLFEIPTIGMTSANKSNNINLLTIIIIYSNKINFKFQLDDILINKMQAELANLMSISESIDFHINIFKSLCYILKEHCINNTLITKKLIVDYLIGATMLNDNTLFSDIGELNIVDNDGNGSIRTTIELCAFIINTFAGDTAFTVNIGINETNGANKIVIRSTQALFKRIKGDQNTRRRNWCANRQIPCGQLAHTQITDPDTNEFLCPITFESQNPGNWIIKLTKCGHNFSAGGIIEWCKKHNTCPICRAKLAAGRLNGANSAMFELG